MSAAGASNFGSVAQLWRYPVKSMRGERCDSLRLDARGVIGDRVYAVHTPEGKFGSGKNTRRFARIDGLLGFQAACVDDTPVIEFPDGTHHRADEPDIGAALSAALGRPVSLQREGAVQHLDAAGVHLVTTAALDALRERLPDAGIDARRFRPNFVIECDRPDEAWIGRRIGIGAEVVLHVLDHTERCVMVGMPQGELPEQAAILRALTRRDEALFGVYAAVQAAGTVRAGDAVTALD